MSEAMERAVEAAAEKIYYLLPYNETSPPIKPPWVPRGNSLKQDEARRYARAALSRPQAPQEPAAALERMNFIKAFWRGQPSCLHLDCTAECNLMTTHCDRFAEVCAKHNAEAAVPSAKEKA